jgi:protein TonB
MRAWLKSSAPYALSMLVHVVLGGGLAVAALFVAREVLAPEPIKVELVVKPRAPKAEETLEALPGAPTRVPRRVRPLAPPQRRKRSPPKVRSLASTQLPRSELPRIQRLPSTIVPEPEPNPEPFDPSLEEEPVRPGPAPGPAYGIALDSNQTGGGTMAVPAGSTLRTNPGGQGAVGGPPGRPPPVREREAPAREIDITEWPERRDQRTFRYPEEARRAGMEGSVLLRLRIDAEGQVIEAALAGKAHPVLEREALANAKLLRFSAARAGQKAVPCEIKYTFTFVLD